MRVEWPISTREKEDALNRAEIELSDAGYEFESWTEGFTGSLLSFHPKSTQATRVWIIGG